MSLDSARLLLIGAVLVAAVFAAMHESHYRSRRSEIDAALLEGLELRMRTVEGILREDRHT